MKEIFDHFVNSYLDTQYPEEYGFRCLDQIRKARQEASVKLTRPHTEKWFKTFINMPDFVPSSVDFSSSIIRFGDKNDIDDNQSSLVLQSLKDLIPWRKGPFEYFGHRIDAEWRSDLKWQRLIECGLPHLEDKIIADIGCNNMYYMYRMLHQNPALVVGFDPMDKYFFFNEFNKKFYNDPRLVFELLGIEDFPLFESFFDVVFFMGIIYHRRNPVDSLQALLKGMKKGGVCFLETIGIPGAEPHFLFPEGRYMKAPGYWFLPTWKGMESMMKRVGFRNVVTLDVSPTTLDEQRKTEWIDTQSLDDFLDPDDPKKTIEGYPAPVRFLIRGEK
ncbi:tRNA 5-methoxyuridine(34)/uridine 5-oxyacetic acid(34) synthase CmoB [Spirochaeta cellobiosiphila]|uniref:tRNA 5-methoxyuridine(34)/uridine 5-oxyacetic acid(34) synthase CmoB n=1 Tax=Spirochaeta cellobiosiphila TaxID=504483 RepID=UPI0003F67E08|nr:tRNA 5-methoxyuridine(34)/uridine 5-oxyacetic acid(34) synthase CmoB [Spirochaeta cellobiosiphila]